LGIAPRAGIKMQVTRYPLAQANTALNARGDFGWRRDAAIQSA
jgi:hypothetical protein